MTTQADAVAALDSARAWAVAVQPAAPPTAQDCRGTAPSLPSFTPPSYWSSRNAYLLRQQGTVPDGSIAFLGDSQFEGWDVAQASWFGWNAGIGGDTTPGLLNRIGGYSCLHHAGAVVVMIGGNDASSWVAGTTQRANHQKLWGWLQGPLVVCKMIHADPAILLGAGGTAYALNGNIDLVNSWIAADLAGRAHCAIVDINSQISETDPASYAGGAATGQRLKSAYHIGDGLHLNAAGYAILAPAVAAALAQVLA